MTSFDASVVSPGPSPRSVAVVAGVALLLAACGQKGPLLPVAPDSADRAGASAAPAASSPRPPR